MRSVGVDLEVDCLAVGNQNSEFADWEMWLNTNITSSAGSNTWVEGGYTAGNVTDPAGHSTTGFQWYWADSRPNGLGYAEHFIKWANAGSYTNLTFQGIGSGNWNVILGGSVVGVSKAVGDNAGDTQVGVEMAVDNSGQTWAHAKNWQYSNGGAWAPVHPVVVISNNAPGFSTGTAYNPTAYTVHTPAHACGTTPLAVPSGANGNVTITPSTVRALAQSAAASKGDSAPKSMRAVLTTRGKATGLDDETTGIADARQAVYMVEETGSFTAAIKAPHGHLESMKGTVLHLVVAANSGQILDWSIQTRSANAAMAKIGSVESLK